jgi:hypothetical protein
LSLLLLCFFFFFPSCNDTQFSCAVREKKNREALVTSDYTILLYSQGRKLLTGQQFYAIS